MATDPVQLQAWRDALFRARLRGVREVRDATGESVRYSTDAEMAAAIAAADRALAALTPVTTIRFITSKGL
jgi:hypothetical protein